MGWSAGKMAAFRAVNRYFPASSQLNSSKSSSVSG
jgi:hypothetical protein